MRQTFGREQKDCSLTTVARVAQERAPPETVRGVLSLTLKKETLVWRMVKKQCASRAVPTGSTLQTRRSKRDGARAKCHYYGDEHWVGPENPLSTRTLTSRARGLMRGL